MSEYIIAGKLDRWDGLATGIVAGEIVRCRDCKHYDAEINGCDEFGDIWHDEYANVEPDGFCAWGERKDDERVHNAI